MAAIANCDSEAVISIAKQYFDFITSPKQKAVAEALHVGAIGLEMEGADLARKEVVSMYSQYLSKPFQTVLTDHYFSFHDYPAYTYSLTEEGGIEDEKKS